ncbi:hypothetical protein [Runella salmonicolor]|uniref:Serine dehydrogenase proteinase n=1 Tax=Runella salmonicolor TaxID=2950278 RepID=A0ABT1FST8_9BACT|nr:hypothetical protein [Runella salmonicolor]MCP1384826.1 hypothetical protein [Runella salmonicolor]
MNMTELKLIVNKISKDRDTDIYLLSSDITDSSADDLINEIKKTKTSAQNCSLLLTTYGGDPDAGFRIVRYIQRAYKEFYLYVFGSCKSTGTLMALGANEIIMSDFGEFGPLDIQLTKDDELTNTSGLSYLQSLIALNERLYESFEQNFMSLKRKSGFTISTRTAAEISSKLAIGIISPISAQIDPLKLGEVNRAIRIADDYGSRLLREKDGSNVLRRLIGDYSSHGFVIDYEEARAIFKDTINVRFVNDDEIILEQNLLHLVRRQTNKTSIFALSNIFAEPDKHTTVEPQVPIVEENNHKNQPLNTQENENAQPIEGTK